MAQTYPSHGVGADFHYSLLWILSAQPASSVTLDSLVNLDQDIEIIIIVTGLQSINCYKATSEFFINLEGKQDVMDAKWPEDLFKRQVQFHAQAMKKVPSLKFPYFPHLPTHRQYKGEFRSEADWLNWWKERGQIVDVGQKVRLFMWFRKSARGR